MPQEPRVRRLTLKTIKDNATVLTNVLTGRQSRVILHRIAREVGPMADLAPEVPLAAGAVASLRAKAEADGSGDFSPLWSGQAGALGRELPARELTTQLAAGALSALERMGRSP
jgi:nitronate monooxygenase